MSLEKEPHYRIVPALVQPEIILVYCMIDSETMAPAVLVMPQTSPTDSEMVPTWDFG